MAFDAFLKIEGVEGEATSEGMTGFMDIESFSFGASNPTTIGTGSGGSSAGKVQMSSFAVMKRTDKASAPLFQACCTGQHFVKAEVHIRKAGGKDNKQQTYLKYSFEKVFIDAIQWSGSSGGEVPMESLSFSFAKVEVEYNMQDAKGAVKKAGQAAWDLEKNSAK